MGSRFASIWFRHLGTDWFTLRRNSFVLSPEAETLRQTPFVLKISSHGRMIISATNAAAEMKGLHKGMVLADARAIVPDLEVQDDQPDLADKLLKRLAEWCIRFTPVVSIDIPDGLLLDVTGCAHLWGGEEYYLQSIIKRLTEKGYDINVAIADTIGLAWAAARFSKSPRIVNDHVEALMSLPPEALRIDTEIISRLHQLGLHRIQQLMNIPRNSLRRRFGEQILLQLDKAFGSEIETITPVQPVEPYQERLPCLEPIITAVGIEIALRELLTTLCDRLQLEQKGLRSALFKCYRCDGKIEQIAITTNRPTYHVSHLFKLFEIKLPTIEPALGIELFVLDAPKVEEYLPQQKKMWEGNRGLEDESLAELVDKFANKFGANSIHRFVPAERYWPELSFKPAALREHTLLSWPLNPLRPLHILTKPEPVEVTSPIPDYPPMLFVYKKQVHKIVKTDGPERIEQEWWLQCGQHRDYYKVEDEDGRRYWIFRLGHYDDEKFQWFLHGFFA